MKIVITVSDIVPQSNDLTIRLRQTIQTLKGAGHEISVISVGGDNLAQQETFEGVSHVRVQPANSDNLLERNDAFGSAVLSYVVENAPDVVHMFGAEAGPMLVKRRDSDRKRRFRIIYEINNLSHLDLPMQFPDLQNSATLQTITERESDLARTADAVITPSRAIRVYSQILGAQPRRIKVVPYSVDVEKFSVTPLEEWPGKSPNLLCLGSFEAWQGLDIMLNAVALVQKQRSVKLRVIGPGTDEERAEALNQVKALKLTKQVSLEKPLPHASLAGVISEATLCLMPLALNDRNVTQSRAPYAMIEYMSCGRPIVGTDMPGLREVVRPGVDALLTAPASAEDMASAMLRLFDDERLARQLATSAAQRVRKDFTREVIGEKLLNVYANLKKPAE